MGQTLSEPVTAKNTACCQNSTYKIGSSSMQGWRVTMEDSHTHILSLPVDPDAAFFAVYDGHGGAKISDYSGKHLHKYITNREEYKEGNIEEAMKEAFLEIDKDMRGDESLTREACGTTAVTILVKDNKVYCANAGDSRAVASIAGKAEALSRDHKPYNREEYERITAAGGYVSPSNRVNGDLALSRALGDFCYKKNDDKSAQEQVVTAYPEVQVHSLTPDWEFLVLACDGIWDVMTNEEVVAFVRERIAQGMEPEEICESLMTVCLAPDDSMAPIGCDNMTVVIVALLHGEEYEELSTKCTRTFTPEEQSIL